MTIEARAGKTLSVVRPYPKDEYPPYREMLRWRDNEYKLTISTGYPDSYVVTWPTDRDLNGLIVATCGLADALKEKGFPPRPMVTGKSNHTFVMGVPLDGSTTESETVTVDSSYSSGNYNVVWPMGDNLTDVTFDKLPWPFNLGDVQRVAESEGGNMEIEPEERDCIRIDTELFSMQLKGGEDDIYERGLSIWTHVFPGKELMDFYRDTAIYPKNAPQVQDLLNIIVAPLYYDDGQLR